MKALRGLLIAATALMFVFVPSAHAATNVVPNPGFEQGGCGNTPVLCGWSSTDPNTSMSQDTTNPHSGSASMNVECAYPACDRSTAGAAAYVSTDPAFCAPIGPGAHQASFWYRDAAATELGLGAAFYATPDCTGSSSSDFFSVSPVAGGWQQAVGALAAPPGTQSALFTLEVSSGCAGACDDPPPCYCGIGANFDDVYVDDVGDTSPPAISSFTPTSGPPLTAVTITGTNFTGATSVSFNGTATPDWYVESSTEIVAFVWDGSTSGPISVTTLFGTDTSTDSFTVTAPPPDICCLDPTSGPVGTSVDIWGPNLIGATSVTFNGTPDPDFFVASSGLIIAHVPAGATSGPVSVTTPGGTATSTGSFTVTAPPPSISSFSPTSGPVGTSVDIQGTSFTGATSVNFNGTADPSFVVNSSTDISAHVPTDATTSQISVTTPGGTATSSTSFTVTPSPPVISSFAPTGGPVGTNVTITGTSLTGASSVKFNGAAAPFTVSSATSITAHVPTGATTGPISVTTPAGTGTSSNPFTVIPPPTITGFSPTSGHSGQQVTITGTNLTNTTSVKLGTTSAQFTVNSSTKITATVPTMPHGYYHWSTTNPAGTTTSTSYFHVL